jgi:hypothetical protein
LVGYQNMGMRIFLTKILAILEGMLHFESQPNKCQIFLACSHLGIANFESQPYVPKVLS